MDMGIASDSNWVPLRRFQDVEEAGLTATSLLAMGFECRLVTDAGDILETLPERDGPVEQPAHPITVQVHANDAADLHAVLDELLTEQHDFTAEVDARRRARELWERKVLLLVLTAVVATMGFAALWYGRAALLRHAQSAG